MPCVRVPGIWCLTDHHARTTDRAAIPMILATSAVHSWLTRKGLRTFCSLNVRSAECIDPHYFRRT